MDKTDAVMDLAKRRGFLWPSFEVYGGMAGFYDYGPLGAMMKKRFEDLWRHVFQNTAVPAAEVACPRVTAHDVLKASGHVDEFTDLVVRCACGQAARADHLITEAGYQGNSDALEPAAIDEQVVLLKPKCPACGKTEWSPATPLNLMFQTEVGPGSGRVGYLRPETAQGIFTDFPHLLRFFRSKLPFAALQVGGSNRNEISPRQGMLRLREFHMMEAEVFFEDTDAPFPAFDTVAERTATFVPNKDEKAVESTFRAAVEGSLVRNQTLAYFLALTQDFLLKAGMDPARLRFRQHLADEMAHYASDCWDAEFYSERYGWVECVGVADRGCYDLMQHALHSGKLTQHPATGETGRILNTEFTQWVELAEPVTFQATRYVPNLGKLGRTFKAQAKAIAWALDEKFLAAAREAGLDDAVWPNGMDRYKVEGGFSKPEPKATTVTVAGEEVEVPADCFHVEIGKWKVTAKQFVPRVIEPSFGVDRILYALWEHAYERGEKNGEPYTVLRLSPHVAPVQVAVLPLTNDESLTTIAQDIEGQLRRAGVLVQVDTSGNIGRRYARQDEVGTPVCITVDPDTLQDGQVTLRDRDTTEQVRVPVLGLMGALAQRFALD